MLRRLRALLSGTKVTCPVRARVLIVQAIVPHYRFKLYELLYQHLLRNCIELQIAYGMPNTQQAAKHDFVDLPEPVGLKVNNYWFWGGKVLYQPILWRMLSVDLVIVLNANGHLLNYPVSVAALLGHPKLAYWVWWKKLRTGEKSIPERLRRQLTRAGQWWFAYTAGIRDYLLLDGMPNEQITTLNNSMDVVGFREALAAVTAVELHEFAKVNHIPIDAPIAVFCGGLYGDKRLEFLFEAVKLIHAGQPDFHLLVIGDGVMRDLVLQAANEDYRIHYFGPSFGKEKALCFRLSKLFLCPGLVGLAILDAFAAGLPMITTDIPVHSPEIEYLNDGVNGLLITDDIRTYADEIVSLLREEYRLQSLSSGALISAQQYSIESMAERFAEGIMSCLQQP